MSSTYGDKIKISIFGQSHGPAIGVVIDGLPAGESVDIEAVEAFLARRAPGRAAFTTSRKEADKPEWLSGLLDGRTCGAPLGAIIRNADTRSGDYAAIADVPRPGHADYPAFIKHGGFNDVRGGGHFSARLTAPLCIAGAVLAQLLERRGVLIGAHIASVGPVRDLPLDPMETEAETLRALALSPFPVRDAAAGEAMQALIAQAAAAGDSVGGVVECCVLGLAPGLGEPMFGGIENEISRCLFAVPAVKGVEFGEGFAAAGLRGSENNDAYRMSDGRVVTESNRAGGILGGLTSGAPLIFRAAFKPTPSIAQEQRSVRLSAMEDTSLAVRGRHDPCVVPRAVPCVEAAAALALSQFIL